MAKYTLKLISIEESGSIGRQLKATVNAPGGGKSFGFEGTSSKHHVISKDVPIDSNVTLPITVHVKEWDAKQSDEPFSGSTNITLALINKNSPPASVTIPIAEVGGVGRNKGKTASLTFHFQAEIKPEYSTRFENVVGSGSWTSGAWSAPKGFGEGASRATQKSSYTKVTV